MSKELNKNLILVTKVYVNPSLQHSFIDWQAKLNTVIAAFPGFISLEILSPTDTLQPNWVIAQRFASYAWINNWRQSKEKQQLMEELIKLLGNDSASTVIEEANSENSSLQGGVTEVFVTQVHPGMEKSYYEWIAKIHQAEAKFPGFKGVYVQSPNQGRNWITLLQFDQPHHLDQWLSSPERASILRESESFISSLENHRVISPYAGWFASIANQGEIPAVWKQTMIVLLVLFPIVMLELKYLSLLTAHLNPSLATFIGNAITRLSTF